jgi:heme-degrading monooxygenase HmoA
MEHVRVAIYGITAGDFHEVARKAEEGMLPTFRRRPGFVSYGLAQLSDTSCMSISVWQSRDDATEAVKLAEDWVRDNIADLIKLENQYVGEFGFLARA